MHVRVLLANIAPTPPARIATAAVSNPKRSSSKPKSRDGAISLTLADFYLLPVNDAFAIHRTFAAALQKEDRSASLSLSKRFNPVSVISNEVGLGYLTLDRPTRSLSGGETERVNLTTCLGSRLVNTLFVLDEPSVGLHPRDTATARPHSRTTARRRKHRRRGRTRSQRHARRGSKLSTSARARANAAGKSFSRALTPKLSNHPLRSPARFWVSGKRFPFARSAQWISQTARSCASRKPHCTT